MIGAIYNRVYQNYLMKSRLPIFNKLINELKNNGYRFITIHNLSSIIINRETIPKKICILRCDVDSDVGVTRLMFDICRKADARATFYFRLATLNSMLMGEIHESGMEVGYHFEELATVAKRRGIASRDHIGRFFSEMQDEFRSNLEKRYLPAAGRLPKTVASHGDFANRKLGITSSCLITEDIRIQYGIVAEAYDDWLNAPVTRRFSDQSAPRWWAGGDPFEAVSAGSDCIYILFHPRQWQANWIVNTRLDVERAYESISYRIRRRKFQVT